MTYFRKPPNGTWHLGYAIARMAGDPIIIKTDCGQLWNYDSLKVRASKPRYVCGVCQRVKEAAK